MRKYRLLIKSGIDPKQAESGSAIDGAHQVTVVKEEDPRDEVITLDKFIPTFMTLHGENQSAKMQESYRTSLGHLLPVFGRERLDDISRVKVQTYMADRRYEVSNATVNREVACLKGILSKVVEWEFIKRNPLLGMKLLKESAIRERYLTTEEAERLINTSGRHLRDIIVFALATGMRQSEIFGLKWDSVVINERFKFGEITVVGKGGKRRNIRMNRTVFEMMKRRREKSTSLCVFPSPKTGGKLIHVKR